MYIKNSMQMWVDISSFILTEKKPSWHTTCMQLPATAQQIHWKQQMLYHTCKHMKTVPRMGTLVPPLHSWMTVRKSQEKPTEILLGSPAVLSPSLLSRWTYYHFLTLKPPRGIRGEAWPINQQMKGPFALFLRNTFFSCTVLNMRFIKFFKKKK